MTKEVNDQVRRYLKTFGEYPKEILVPWMEFCKLVDLVNKEISKLKPTPKPYKVEETEKLIVNYYGHKVQVKVLNYE